VGKAVHYKKNEQNVSKAKVVTMGCRLNFSESEVMKTWADAQGLDNAIIVNTCAVTSEAERQARQKIRQLRRRHPDAYIIATGCAVQLRPKAFAAMGEIDRVVGNAAKESATHFVSKQGPRVQVGPMPATHGLDQFPYVSAQGKVKAFVQVQNGCNHFCTFCTIPLARGRARSVAPDAVVSHVAQILDQGVQEIVLTGVDLTSYDWDGMMLGGLVHHMLDTLPHLRRLRLSSLDSIEVDEQLEHLITHNPRVMPHIHLSLQSGSDPILASMKRRHTRDQAIRVCRTLKDKRPEIALGADFITGFPGETEAMFQETMDMVDACQLSHLHVFPYSRRPGTPAARMTHQVDSVTIKERAQRLRYKGSQALYAHLSAQIGKTITILAEQKDRGHADDFSDVTWDNPVDGQGLYTATVRDIEDKRLRVSNLQKVAL
jgi:threonylcarbamoyladenosine tRNA methylthiotransferase MtaB